MCLWVQGPTYEKKKLGSYRMGECYICVPLSALKALTFWMHLTINCTYVAGFLFFYTNFSTSWRSFRNSPPPSIWEFLLQASAPLGLLLCFKQGSCMPIIIYVYEKVQGLWCFTMLHVASRCFTMLHKASRCFTMLHDYDASRNKTKCCKNIFFHVNYSANFRIVVIFDRLVKTYDLTTDV